MTGLGYAQVVIAGNGGKNFTGTANVFTMSQTQYNTYRTSAPLQAAYDSTTGNAGSGGLVSPPSAGNFTD